MVCKDCFLQRTIFFFPINLHFGACILDQWGALHTVTWPRHCCQSAGRGWHQCHPLIVACLKKELPTFIQSLPLTWNSTKSPLFFHLFFPPFMRSQKSPVKSLPEVTTQSFRLPASFVLQTMKILAHKYRQQWMRQGSINKPLLQGARVPLMVRQVVGWPSWKPTPGPVSVTRPAGQTGLAGIIRQ